MADNATFTHRAWKLIREAAETRGDRLPHIHAIVTDHLGTPQQVLDERRQVVWQATTAPFGQADVKYAVSGSNGKPFEMNLRLPGQVYDAKTGLHYNYLRDYDPQLGRYLAPVLMGAYKVYTALDEQSSAYAHDYRQRSGRCPDN